LDTIEAAAVLGLQPNTLERWRCLRISDLKFTRFQGRIRYMPDQIRQYLESNAVTA
jgi:hypothetical protein